LFRYFVAETIIGPTSDTRQNRATRVACLTWAVASVWRSPFSSFEYRSNLRSFNCCSTYTTTAVRSELKNKEPGRVLI